MKAVSKKTPDKKMIDKKTVDKKTMAKKTVAKKTVVKKGAPAKAVAAAAAPPPVKLGPKKLTRLVPLLASMVPTGALDATVLDRLFAVITERRGVDPTESHSARLLSRGMPKVAQKFGEEAVECLIEAVGGNREAMVAESADVLYHLLVMWVAAGVVPGEVWSELARREGVSGIAEKASRTRGGGTTKIP